MSPINSRAYNRAPAEAQRLGISRRTLSNWIRSGAIPSIRFGKVVLFDPAKVDEALLSFERIPVTRA